MNYRHAFHAGNFADVLKHVLLSRILVHLSRKPSAWRYIDTHAGVGRYDLAGEEARRGGEWRDGIGRIDPATMPEAARLLLAPYLAAVGPRAEDGRPLVYPGSPLVALSLARPADRMLLCELHPDDQAMLRRAVGRRATGRESDVKVLAMDGYVALNAAVPPPERRGLVLIDPPFEQKGEFDAMLERVVAAHRKWPTGIYALWYPLKDQPAVGRFLAGLAHSGMRRIHVVDLVVDPAALARGALGGCGIVLVNPPHGLEEDCRTLLPYLAMTLGQQEPASSQWRCIVGE